MTKKHKLEYISNWAKENNITKWSFLFPEEVRKKKENSQKTYNNKKRNYNYDK